MSTVTPVTGGFKITGANSIAASLSLSPANGTAEFIGRFPKADAISPNTISCLLVYNPPSGQESGEIDVSQPTVDQEQFPSGTFTNRTVAFTVTDTGPNRTVDVSVTSTDGTGTNESWGLNLQITYPTGNQATWYVLSVTSEATVSGVTALP